MSLNRAPGYSVDLTDALRIASRCARGLGGVTQIGADELAKWYNERPTKLVHAVQLRRERAGPYFHQFFAFKLEDGDMFRIDRRLRPDESAPQNSLSDEGIPAYDTIEPVVAWDDPLFVASDCLISIEFKVEVHLALILKVCQQIQAHQLSKVYTLQRYNCYFFAQTLILCLACGVSNWTGMGTWLSMRYNYYFPSSRQGLPVLTPNSNAGIFGTKNPANKNSYYPKRHKGDAPPIKQFRFKGIVYSLLITAESEPQSRPPLSEPILSLADRLIRSIPREILEISDEQDMRNRLATNLWDLVDRWWRADRTRLIFKCCRQVTKRSIWDVDKGSYDAPVRVPMISLICRLPTPGLVVARGYPPRLVRLDPSKSGPNGPRLPFGMRATRGECDVHLSICQFDPLVLCGKAGATLVPRAKEIHYDLVRTCLDSFEQNMNIEINQGKLQNY
ncbi:unnamed protein product [Rhizoctonia solani]|uniref:Uncharacterized protein n=1 Tax=Rhizoctonia solani TaxID=456999 RepID=A0A8H3DZD7_9AGAM|nr:unnamed protein product [Rhizoctonia solani]